MNRNRFIYIKALLLLVVFSINTMVSFACSVSDFVHSSHHSIDKSVPVHTHNNGEHHGHHDHGQDKNKHNEDNSDPLKKKDNCCSSIVIKIDLLDKAVSKNIDAPSALTFLHVVILPELESPLSLAVRDWYFPQHLRWPPATIPDIRIAIQSFQI